MDGEPIDVYNHGNMTRDFTYIDDLVFSMMLLIEKKPASLFQKRSLGFICNQSPVAPFRVVNIGNSNPHKLTDFIKAIEDEVGIKAKKNMMPMQAGDVPKTWADTSLLEDLIGCHAKTNIREGVKNFVNGIEIITEFDKGSYNSMKIKKAVFPVAGFGTRFLPATTIPKELLPIVDKPLVQYAAEEAIDAGIISYFCNRSKQAFN